MEASARHGLGLLALLVVLAVLVGLNVLLRTPMETSGFTVYRDDAYYYFAMVESLARGERPSVSDGAPTNGGQLGWVLVLLPTVWFGDGGPERMARWVGLACLVAASLLLGRHAFRITRDRLASAVAVASLLATPLLWLEAQNGQETGLVILASVLLFTQRRAGRWAFVACSLIAVLARVDLLAYVLALEWSRRFGSDDSGGGARGSGRLRLYVPSTTLLALVVWMVGNLFASGSATSDAGLPMAWLFWQRFLATDPDRIDWLQHLWFHGRPVLFGGPFLTAFAVWGAALIAAARPVPTRAGAWSILLLLGVLAAGVAGDLEVPLLAMVLVVIGIPDPGRGPDPGMRSSAPDRCGHPVGDGRGQLEARLLVVASLVLVLVHGLLRLYPRDYYWAPIAAFGAAVAAVRLHRWRPSVLAAGVVLAGLIGLGDPGGPAATRCWQPRPWQAVQEFAASQLPVLLPEDAKVGAFNAGLVAAHAGRAVVNLDGVVDLQSFRALRHRQLGDMLVRRRVDWILDHPVQLERDPTLPHANGRYFGVPGPEVFAPRLRFLCPGVDAGRPGTDEIVLFQRVRATDGPFLLRDGALQLEGPRGMSGFVWHGRPRETLFAETAGGLEPLAVGDDGVPVVVVLGGDLSEFGPNGLKLFNRTPDGDMIRLR